MRKYIFYIIIFLPGLLLAQPTVYNKITNQIQYATNVICKGNNYLICYRKNFADDFGLAEIDSNGNIINNNYYGTPLGWEELAFARRQSNNEIIMMGLTFWDGVTNIGDYKGYANIIDTSGNFKKAFIVKGNTTRLNKIYNGIFLDNYYYFTGEELDSSLYQAPTKLFLCKTDTMGNMIWYKRYPQFDISIGATMGFEHTYDKMSLLIGVSTTDSVTNNGTYSSYFLLKLDTSGNYINRIILPEFASNIHYTGVNPICQITQMLTDKYVICGVREHYLVDNQFNIIDSFDLVQNIHPGFFASENLYENSYLVGGDLGFSKIYQGNTMFTKDFSNDPNIVSIQDVISTYDGGYLAVILNTGGSTRYVKMDCEGNYINPIYCWPTNTHEVAKIDLHMNYFDQQLLFNNKSALTLQAKLYDIQGRPLREHLIKPGITNYDVNNFASGIYIVCVFNENMVIRAEKIRVE